MPRHICWLEIYILHRVMRQGLNEKRVTTVLNLAVIMDIKSARLSILLKPHNEISLIRDTCVAEKYFVFHVFQRTGGNIIKRIYPSIFLARLSNGA